ncbi:hypothetical protein BXU09_14775 [Deinococcus sp. LM3]|nr:hypothetical protein BXU09_14775 [Deinococcus sp. LM3]
MIISLYIFSILVSGSRTVFVIALFMLLFQSLVTGFKTFFYRLSIVIFLAAILFYWNAEIFFGFSERFISGDTSLNYGGIAINGEGRSNFWDLILSRWSENRYLGNGIGDTEIIMSANFYTEQGHNDYLRLLNDFGILGLGIYFIFLISIIIRLYKSENTYSSIALYSVGGFLISMITDNTIVYSFVMIPLGIVIGMGLKKREVSEL